MAIQYDYIEEILPHDIFFVTTQELSGHVPGQHAEGARILYYKRQKALSASMKIGDTLENGEPHDGRAPDYDDWSVKRRYSCILSGT